MVLALSKLDSEFTFLFSSIKYLDLPTWMCGVLACDFDVIWFESEEKLSGWNLDFF